MSENLAVYLVNRGAGACTACAGYKRVVEIEMGNTSKFTIRLCRACALELTSAFVSLYGVEPVRTIADNPELIAEFETLSKRLGEIRATMRRTQVCVTHGY